MHRAFTLWRMHMVAGSAGRVVSGGGPHALAVAAARVELPISIH